MTQGTPVNGPSSSKATPSTPAPATTATTRPGNASLPATIDPAAVEGPIAKWTKYVGARSAEFAELARARGETAAEQVRERSRAMLVRRSRRKLLGELGENVFEERAALAEVLSAASKTRVAKIEALDEELRSLQAEGQLQ